MALSLLSTQSTYTDLQQQSTSSSAATSPATTAVTAFDPLRIYFDFSFPDQMEFSSATAIINQQNHQHQHHHHHHHHQQQQHQITITQRNFSDGTQTAQTQQTGNNFHDYDQVINFVDSPPNSKESWGDYGKSEQQQQQQQQQQSQPQGATIVDVRTIYTNQSGNTNNRKRRMDWEALDINQGTNSTSSIESKVPNLGNNKDRDKKKISGRGSWTDDIDFDLNGEFTSNGYLNNETFLSLSSALTVLKQEIPSPSSAAPATGPVNTGSTNNNSNKRSKSPLETCGGGAGNNNGANLKDLLNDEHEKDLQPKSNRSNDSTESSATTATTITNTGSNQSQLSGEQQQQQAGHNSLDAAGGGQQQQRNIGATSLGSFQQILQQPPNLDSLSAKNSPNPILDVQKSSGDIPPDDYKFQYILAAATSIATKSNEETLTYLNQGQSYEIKLKKLGDLSYYRGKILKSVIKICFHERRLQYMEREQMQQWQASRPGERIIEVDVPLSYGLCHVSQPLNPNLLNTVDVLWDPMKEVGVYIKVNCISTEFTPKKHGGEKGVPFRIQIETYLDTGNSENLNKPIHAAACQTKVFKLKGADRKHKQDREKIQRRPPSEQEKFQPSYECTILNDISLESIVPTGCYSPEYIKPTVSPLMPNSPVHVPKYDGIMPFANNPSPIAINNVTSTNTTSNFKLMDQNIVSPPQVEIDDYCANLNKDSSPTQVAQWLTFHRLNTYVATFTHFSGSDILRMSKEDLIQICGLADGIRMFNTLHAKAITPRLTIYISLDGSNYHAMYLISNTIKELTQKLFKLPGFYELCTTANSPNMNGVEGNMYPGWGMQSKYSGSGSNLYDASKIALYVNGPSGIHVLVTDEVLNNIKDDSLFTLEVQNGKVLMKAIYKNETN